MLGRYCCGVILPGLLGALVFLQYYLFGINSGRSGSDEFGQPTSLSRVSQNSRRGMFEQGALRRAQYFKSSDGPTVDFGVYRRPCTAADLLPSLDEATHDRWVQLGVNDSRLGEYNCSCPYTKVSYVCPHGRLDYPSWVPKVLTHNECSPVEGELLAAHPFPPGSSLLFYGNSHLRQVLEGIMCRYSHMVVRREAIFAWGDRNIKVQGPIDPLAHCRGRMRDWAGFLTDQACVESKEASQAVRCCDDRAVFELDDKTVIHFFFAAENVNKSIDIALNEFGTSPEDYDFAVFNAGNMPTMPTDEALISAQRIHEANGSFVWLTTYDGEGDVRSWSSEQQQAFLAADAKFIAVNSMMESMVDFTRGAAEGISDSHFCLPGPPDELGLLLRQVIWALSFERRL